MSEQKESSSSNTHIQNALFLNPSIHRKLELVLDDHYNHGKKTEIWQILPTAKRIQTLLHN